MKKIPRVILIVVLGCVSMGTLWSMEDPRGKRRQFTVAQREQADLERALALSLQGVGEAQSPEDRDLAQALANSLLDQGGPRAAQELEEMNLARMIAVSLDEAEIRQGQLDTELIQLCSSHEETSAERVQQLIDVGADVNARASFLEDHVLLYPDGTRRSCREGFTPLQLAVYRRKVAIVELLTWNGAHLEVRDDDGWTPLMYCCVGVEEEGDLRICKALLNAGADKNAQNNRGQTALHLCVFLRNVKRLLHVVSGADLTLCDNRGDTPLMFAVRTGHVLICFQLLLALAEEQLFCGVQEARKRLTTVRLVLKRRGVPKDLWNVILLSNWDLKKDFVRAMLSCRSDLFERYIPLFVETLLGCVEEILKELIEGAHKEGNQRGLEVLKQVSDSFQANRKDLNAIGEALIREVFNEIVVKKVNPDVVRERLHGQSFENNE